MTKSPLNSVSPIGASEYIQFVSCIPSFKFFGHIESESRAAGRNERGTANEKKKVDGEVAYGDIWPRKAETLFAS